MGLPALERVAIVARPHLRHLHLALARELRDNHGSEVHMLCGSPEAATSYLSMGADALAGAHALSRALPAKWDEVVDYDAVIERARRVEERFGVRLNQLAMTNRHLGRGFALAGNRHPRSRQSEGMEHPHVLTALCDALEEWATKLQELRITALLEGGAMHAPVTRTLGIPMRTFASSRYRNLHSWTVDEFRWNPMIERTYESLSSHNDGSGGEFSIDAPEKGHAAIRARVLQGMTARRTLERGAKTTAVRLRARLRGEEKGRTYLIRSELAYLARQWRDARRLTGRGVARLSDIDDQPFAFYPLHVEPEIAMHVLSPEFFAQHAAIAAIARDLPPGVQLVVKDHVAAVGRRPTDFYAQLSELKNVVMVDMTELGLEVVRRAALVFTITGSSGFEAAAMGKPVITFGRHNGYGFLPHVQVVTDLGDLRRHIDHALSADFDRVKARADGQRFLRAIVEASVDLRDLTDSNPEAFDADVVKEVLADLEKSFIDARSDY